MSNRLQAFRADHHSYSVTGHTPADLASASTGSGGGRTRRHDSRDELTAVRTRQFMEHYRFDQELTDEQLGEMRDLFISKLDGYISIRDLQLDVLREFFQKRHQMIAFLDRLVTTFNLGPPKNSLNREMAWESFQKLKAYDSWTQERQRFGYTDSRFKYEHPLGKHGVEQGREGALVPDFFFSDIRYDCAGARKASPNTQWASPSARREVFHQLLDNRPDKIDRRAIRKALGMRHYIAVAYRPALAKAVFDFIKPETVLDLSMGWGERLTAFEASQYGKTYYGIDPDKRIIEAGRKLHKFMRQGRKNIELFCSPAEDFMYEALEQDVDMIYFAPPPFDSERYNDDETQAYKRHKTPEAFIHDFMGEAIIEAWDRLKPGGVLLLDLADLRGYRVHSSVTTEYKQDQLALVDPLLDLLNKALPDAEIQPAMGALVGRQHRDSRDKVRIDPLWLVTKGAASFADDILL